MKEIVLFLTLVLGINFAAYSTPVAVETILSATVVDVVGDQNVFANSFDYRDNQVFTVHVEPGGSGIGKEGVNLRTVVRKGVRTADGRWHWSANVLEDRTIRDGWHTQASIALDKEGYVHVAYNMHNMPWQYSVSTNPFDISNWQFRGQPISMSDIEAVKFHNQTPFPQIGSAAIPGNQVTYPMFFKDKSGDLYVTYRYAIRPAKSWKERAFAGGLAKYDVITKTWKSIGGVVPIAQGDAQLTLGDSSATQHPLIFQDGYSVYLITLIFDSKNGMHAFWHWRAEGAGMNTTRPSYAYSPDGINFFRSNSTPYQLPINLKSAELISNVSPDKEYYAPKHADVLIGDNPLIVLQPTTGERAVSYLDKANGQWSLPEETPFAASEIIVDRAGIQWAFASGLRVFRRVANNKKWIEYGQIGSDLCAPKVLYVPAENRFMVHAKSCDGKLATIFSFRGR